MRRYSWLLLLLTAFLGLSVLTAPASLGSEPSPHGTAEVAFPPDLQSYEDAELGVLARVRHRISANPFNLVATVIFALAIIHTFLSQRFKTLSHRFEHAHAQRVAAGTKSLQSVSHRGRFFHFLGDIEIVFGLWCMPLLLAVVLFFDWSTAVHYVSHTVNYTEALFVVVIMTLASSRPILKLAEASMSRIARIFGGSLTAWWLTILTVGPLLGSFITEPATMTICALLLVHKFYQLDPSPRLKYATLGLLFVNISVGGTLTHFAAPPVLMVAEAWDWGTRHMLLNFGWKAALGIVVSNVLYWVVFRREFDALREKFAVRTLEDETLATCFPREECERAIDRVIVEVEGREGPLLEELAPAVTRFVAGVKERLRQQVEEDTKDLDVDRAILDKAFEERFEEIKRSRLQRTMPSLLPESERAPFVDPRWDDREDAVPAWVMAIHVAFMGWTIVNAHHPALFVAGLLFFLGFATVTADYQNRIDLRSPLLVGFFLGGLVTHGGVQGWWIEPVLGSLDELPLSFVATMLTAFNDNAAITYLATLVPGFDDGLKYAVVAGAVTGGGLTVIANAPNPAGQSILNRHFDRGIAPAGLLTAALIPTVIMFLVFNVLR